MQKLLPPENIYISQSKMPNAGRGVFAGKSIKKGELIESCPVLEIPEHDASSFQESILVTYIYYLGHEKNRMMLALGYGSIYNHTDIPNALYKEIYEDKIINFFAVKDIQKDEEITVNYSQGNQQGIAPLWFTVKIPDSKEIYD